MSTENPEHYRRDPVQRTSRGAQHSILLATIDDLSVPHHLASAISSATEWTQKRITIVLVSKLFDNTSSSHETSISHTQRWNEVQSILTFVYVQATKVAQFLDRVLMDVDVLLVGLEELLPRDIADGVDTLYRIHYGTPSLFAFCGIGIEALIRSRAFASAKSTGVYPQSRLAISSGKTTCC